MIVTVVIPTVAGRELKLARCLHRYRSTVPAGVMFHQLVMRGYRSCGEAWNVGAEMAASHSLASTWDVVHFGADDLLPHRGWLGAALASFKRREIPGPLVLRPDGVEESRGGFGGRIPDGMPTHSTVVPILPMEAWPAIRPIPSIHYYSDDYIGRALEREGWPIVMNDGYCFTHDSHPSDPGRDVARSGEYEQMMEALG